MKCFDSNSLNHHKISIFMIPLSPTSLCWHFFGALKTYTDVLDFYRLQINIFW